MSTLSMTLREEALIEAFALNPGSLSAAECDEAIALINQSAEAGALHEYLDRFYCAFHSTVHMGLAEWTERFVNRILKSPSTVMLMPRRTVLRDTRTGTIHTPRLAAATKMHRAFELIGSSISEDGETNIRFIHDHESGRVRIYVITSQEGLRRDALILFQGSSVMLMTDESGQAALDHDLFEQLGLVERPVILRPLKHEFDVLPKDLGSDYSSVGPDRFPVKAKSSTEKVCLSFDTDTGILFGHTSSSAIWKHVRPDSCIEATDHKDEPIHLRIYG